MGFSSKTVTIASAMAGLAVFSQAPEFAQQYRQRLGGALDELKTVVTDFDRDADNSQLSREQALDQMTRSNERLTHDRGQSMRRTVGRYQRLSEQQKWLENSHPLTRPLLVLKNLDKPLIENAWSAFEPAVPVTSPGVAYGGLGAIIAMLLARLGIGGSRRLGQSRKDRQLAKAIEQPQPTGSSGIATAEQGGGANKNSGTSQSDDDGVAEYDNRVLARRMEKTIARAKGVPSSMQVAPMGRQNVPYLKTKPKDQADSS